MISFMTCEPAMAVPTQPIRAHFQACGPRLIRNSETIWRLPGGRYLVKLVMRSSRLVWLPQRLVAMAKVSSKVGKKARKRLKAMACEIMPQRGKTRARMRRPSLESKAAEIMWDQYKQRAFETQEMSRPALPGACAHRKLKSDRWRHGKFSD